MAILLLIEDLLCASPFHSLRPYNDLAKVGVHRKVTANPLAQKFRVHLGVASGAARRRPREEAGFTLPAYCGPGFGCT